MVGNIPNFTSADVLRCFLKFSRKIGRQELAKELELGEGTVRTILDLLKSKKFLDSTKKGHFLSAKGDEALKELYSCISAPKAVKIQTVYPDLKKAGVLIKGILNLKEAYKLRDLAVKSGADGALILKFDGHLHAPELDSSQDYSELEKYFDFEGNDVLVIAFSGQKREAENGAISIAIELNSVLKKFISGLK